MTARRARHLRRVWVFIALAAGLLLASGDVSHAQLTIPRIPFVEPATSPEDVSVTLQVLFLLTLLSLAPSILIMVTAFTRIIVVLSLLRQALATQQLPPNQVLVGLALFLTFMVMAPVWNEVNAGAITPYLNREVGPEEAFQRALVPVRDFMFNQTRKQDLRLFLDLSEVEKAETRGDVPTTVLIPAFIISELRRAFVIGFYLFLPFVIIDMVVASVLISMGMLMLPPVLISLPFKILLFVLVDGWRLISGALVRGFT